MKDRDVNIEEYEKLYSDVRDGKGRLVSVGDNLNLGCGFNPLRGFINVDMFDNCNPDVVWDLNKLPWPWEDNSMDYIFAAHVLEHLDDWWSAIEECGRILKPKGTVHIRVPDESDSGALTYRDHKHVLSVYSFYGLQDDFSAMIRWHREKNAWTYEHYGKVPLKIVSYVKVPYKQYLWMIKWCPWLLTFCSVHMRNFVFEQRIELEKMVQGEFEKYRENHKERKFEKIGGKK